MTKSDVSTQYTDTNSIPAHVMTLSVPPSLPRPPSSFFLFLSSILSYVTHPIPAPPARLRPSALRSSIPLHSSGQRPLRSACGAPLLLRLSPLTCSYTNPVLLHMSQPTPPPLPLAMSRSPHRRHYGWGRGGGRGGRSIPYCAAEWQDSDQVRPLVTPAETRRRQRSY